jgi:hypothetical protein
MHFSRIRSTKDLQEQNHLNAPNAWFVHACLPRSELIFSIISCSLNLLIIVKILTDYTCKVSSGCCAIQIPLGTGAGPLPLL